MTPIELSSAQQDKAAVAAVQRGDAERYRELVERHERRVFAVAWSRLGDAALAEEVTQEAFIRAYRRLWLIGDGAKFAGWVSAIARRTAINLGLRQRRELNRRERWALEQFDPAGTSSAPDETDPLHTPETLRQTLAELPSAHRECLVLFYLEGKSGAEAAAALGISESALRVRLHRARAALRERLEDKLAGSLAKLRPSQALVPAVMAGVLASASAKAATAGGAGSAILVVLGKFTPFKSLFLLGPLLLPAIMILPGWFWSRWLRRDEQLNFRDPQGFRATLYRQAGGNYFPMLCLLLIGGMVLVLSMIDFGINGFPLSLGLFSFGLVGVVARQLQINRSWAQIAPVIGGLVLGMVCLGVWLGRLPVLSLSFAAFFSSGLGVFSARSRPVRMDYNLFLRAAQGMLPAVDGPGPSAAAGRLDRTTLGTFARFLGERQLVNNFRWGAGGLTLCLPAMKSSWPALWGQLYPMTGINSTVALGWNGSVTAHCRKRDAAVLQTMRGSPAADPAGLEKQVAGAMSAAWQYLRAGNINLAERAVGQIPDAEIFVVPTHRIRASRWLRAVFIVIAAMCLMLLVGGWLFQERLSGMKPVNLTEAQVRAFLSMITTNPNPIIGNEQEGYPYDPGTALFDGLVLPSTNLFPPAGLRGMRDAVAGNGGFELLKQQGGQAQWVFGAPLARHAVADGWIGWSDLEIQPSDAAAFLRKSHYMNLPDQWQEWFLTRCGAWSWVKQERFEVKRIQLDGLSSLRLLRDVNCLDLVPREKLIQQIASVQVLSATPTTDKPPIHDWRDVRGLFFTPGFPALQDTYYSLAALEILGGLDRIDREACIRGILGRHEGRGFFTSPSSGSYNEYDIDGSVHDSVAAFESLRILGALDRVKDLDRWQFRVASYNASTPDTNGVRTLTWEEVEAWVCQQRLAKIVEERREHPGAPVRSLLEP